MKLRFRSVYVYINVYLVYVAPIYVIIAIRLHRFKLLYHVCCHRYMPIVLRTHCLIWHIKCRIYGPTLSTIVCTLFMLP